MDISINASFLPHLDAEASLAFYRDALGFELRKDVGYADMRWLTVGPAGQPDVNVVLYPPTADPNITDVDAAFARIQATGVDVLQEPTDQDWGMRDCAFRDPAGNTIRMQQVP
jgi:uncharacterized glyoxalase superfamily protein PhnB